MPAIFHSGFRRTSSSSKISKFLVSVLRALLCIPEDCSPNKEAVDVLRSPDFIRQFKNLKVDRKSLIDFLKFSRPEIFSKFLKIKHVKCMFLCFIVYNCVIIHL